MRSTASLANATYTGGFSVGAHVEVAPVRFEAGGGFVASFNFGSGDHAYGNFTTTAPGSATAPQLSAGIDGGVSFGVGNVNSFLGQSNAGSVPIGPVASAGISYNDAGYKGVNLSVSYSMGPGGAGAGLTTVRNATARYTDGKCLQRHAEHRGRSMEHVTRSVVGNT
jgi:hypothetical protein